MAEGEDDFPDFELIPVGGEPTDIDEELADLIDPDDVADVERNQNADELPIGRSPLVNWDTQRGMAGRNPLWVRDLQPVVLVAQVAIRYKRGTKRLFDREFGMNNPDAMIGFNDDPERRAEYEKDVIETLLACHDRITAVGNFVYTRDPTDELLYVDLEIEIDGEEEVLLERIPASTAT